MTPFYRYKAIPCGIDISTAHRTHPRIWNVGCGRLHEVNIFRAVEMSIPPGIALHRLNGVTQSPAAYRSHNYHNSHGSYVIAMYLLLLR